MIAHNQSKPVVGKDRSPLRFLDPRVFLDFLASRGEDLRMLINGLRRRQGWFLEGMTFRRFINMATIGTQYFLKNERMHAMPAAVKIDISPMCNLSCTVCVHADPNGESLLEKQEFHPQHRMSVEQFRRIIKEIKHVTSAVSLYYVGDPLVHPDLDEMSSIARDAGLNVHISTNFSFSFTDARIKRMVQSGLTHLSVCVDGLSQKKYELTRVGGRIDKVLHNLKRVCQYKKELGLDYPKVEVQYIKFRHNVDELEAAQKAMEDLGVDQFTHFWGDLGNYTDRDPGTFDVVGPKKNKWLPQCYWPHASMVIKYNGDVIPCCTYRIGQQYTAADDPKVFGNVFKTSLKDVWNNQAFRQARRFVSNPELVETEPELKNHFCYGCGALFNTTSRQAENFGNGKDWEEMYELGPDGRPIAKRIAQSNAVSQIGLPGGQMVSV